MNGFSQETIELVILIVGVLNVLIPSILGIMVFRMLSRKEDRSISKIGPDQTQERYMAELRERYERIEESIQKLHQRPPVNPPTATSPSEAFVLPTRGSDLAEIYEKLSGLACEVGNVRTQLGVAKVGVESMSHELASIQGGVTNNIAALKEDFKIVQSELGDSKKGIESLKDVQEQTLATLSYEFNEVFRRERSWLATPYPRALRVDPGAEPPKLLERGGLRWERGIKFYLLCEDERCEWLNDRNEFQKPYIFQRGSLDLASKEVGEAAHLIVLTFAVEQTQHPIDLSVALLDSKLVHSLKEAADLMPPSIQTFPQDAYPGAIGQAVGQMVEHLSRSNGNRRYLGMTLESREWATILDKFQDDLRKMLQDKSLVVLEPGSIGHLSIGRLIDAQDQRSELRLGGLVRVLRDEKTQEGLRSRSQYLWVCDHCRKTKYNYR